MNIHLRKFSDFTTLIKSEEFTVTLTSINARKFKSTIFSFKKFVDYKKNPYICSQIAI